MPDNQLRHMLPRHQSRRLRRRGDRRRRQQRRRSNRRQLSGITCRQLLQDECPGRREMCARHELAGYRSERLSGSDGPTFWECELPSKSGVEGDRADDLTPGTQSDDRHLPGWVPIDAHCKF